MNKKIQNKIEKILLFVLSITICVPSISAKVYDKEVQEVLDEVSDVLKEVGGKSNFEYLIKEKSLLKRREVLGIFWKLKELGISDQEKIDFLYGKLKKSKSNYTKGFLASYLMMLKAHNLKEKSKLEEDIAQAFLSFLAEENDEEGKKRWEIAVYSLVEMDMYIDKVIDVFLKKNCIEGYKNIVKLSELKGAKYKKLVEQKIQESKV